MSWHLGVLTDMIRYLSPILDISDLNKKQKIWVSILIFDDIEAETKKFDLKSGKSL